jgi:hypothetical protein
MSANTPRSARLSPFAIALLLAVTLAITAGLSAVWAGVAALTGGIASWMTVVAALDAALVLRLASHPSGRRRAALAVGITLLTVLAAAVLVSAAKIGMSLGMRPAEALGRMSPELVQLYVGANVGWLDALWLLGGCALAWRAGR